MAEYPRKTYALGLYKSHTHQQVSLQLEQLFIARVIGKGCLNLREEYSV